jgi:drug/metabolite transporter (DMT)-like permease
MSSNLGVLLLNKLLLSYWSFKQPVLLTFLHMASSVLLTWGLWSVRLLNIQWIQSRRQMVKVMTLSLVFALAVLCANVSLKFLAVSMNQAIGAATPVFAAIFALLVQGAFRSLLVEFVRRVIVYNMRNTLMSCSGGNMHLI